MTRATDSSAERLHHRVYVAMSGGVDSSVVAALMVRAGHEVAGITMQMLPDADDAGDAVASAAHVCEALGIAHHIVDCRDLFERAVVGPFAVRYASGSTPNPCVTCNDLIKFGALFDYARELGADIVATGHYARLVRDEGRTWLERGADLSKDQSYFLYRLTDPVIDHVAFPLGDRTKIQVRALAEEYGLPNSARKDSQDVCFLGREGHSGLVAGRHPESAEPGAVVDTRGFVLGTHRGLVNYTVGQRKGLGIASSEPLYVIALEPETNRLVVGSAAEMPHGDIVADDAIWRVGHSELPVTIQTRYRMEAVPAIARIDGEELVVRPLEPMGPVAPGQAVVCYSGERVIGGGTIRCVR
ncbi:MAG: tRNA 2-thiouridine(34) synthase MnmA [Coriobacteriia bacterium]